MKQSKIFEKKLYHFVGTTNQDDRPIVKDFLSFWKHYDILFHTNHYETILALASEDAKRYTVEGLAMNLNMSGRTLLRYRKLYLESYLSFCDSEGVLPE